jgi:SAM-dependent methyltransferase
MTATAIATAAPEQRPADDRTGALTAPVGRHADAARTAPDALVRRWLREGKLWLLPLLLSDHGRAIVARKYDAFSTDRAYENRPSGRLGPLGALIDWIVLNQDNHAGLRQRLDLVVDELTLAAWDTWARHPERPARVVSAPCGLARDLRRAWAALERPTGRLELLGLDLDPTGDVLPAAARLADEAGVPLRTARCDLLADGALARALGGRRADLFNCIGLSPWLDGPDLERLLRAIAGVLAGDGILLLDRFCAPRVEAFARDLEIRTRYHSHADFASALGAAGFEIVATRPSKNGVSVVYRCRGTGG